MQDGGAEGLELKFEQQGPELQGKHRVIMVHHSITNRAMNGALLHLHCNEALLLLPAFLPTHKAREKISNHSYPEEESLEH